MVSLVLKNYRCFVDEQPARFNLVDGLVGFVGVNNSGKSTLLRFPYEFRGFLKMLSGNLEGGFRGHISAGLPRGMSELFNNSNTRNMTIEISIDGGAPEEVDSVKVSHVDRIVITILRENPSWSLNAFLGTEELRLGGITYQWTTLGGTERQGLRLQDASFADFSEIQSAISSIANSMYIGPFRNAIAVKGEGRYYDMVIGSDFVRGWRKFKSGSSKENSDLAFQLTEDIRNVFGFSDLEINASDDETTLQVFVNGKSYWLSELGAGLAQFVLVLTNIVQSKVEYVLIDEPESNLHPSLQMEFLTTIASYAGRGVAYATHNIGLARAYADAAYSIRYSDSGYPDLRELEATPRLAEFLGELSFSGQRELGFNKILLVEGKTDVKTYQQFLRTLQKGTRFCHSPPWRSRLDQCILRAGVGRGHENSRRGLRHH